MFGFFKKTKVDPAEALKKLFGTYALPSFSGTIMQTLQTIRNPDSSAADVATRLSLDPGLTVRLLRIANSAAFSPVRKIENLSQAVALVGLSQLESIVLSAAVSVSIPQDPSHGFNFDRFWKMSIFRAVLAKELSRVLHPTRAPEAFVAGFLQDLALPFLVFRKPDEYLPILEAWYGGEADLCSLERETFSWDHAEVATWICSEWDFPEMIASAIGAHHSNADDVYQTLPAVSLVALFGETDIDADRERVVDSAFDQYGVDKDRVVDMIERGKTDADELAKLMH